ncbi:TPA: hypothetical protein HA273_00455 [Candidatus Bathyarchaeota archaeon]|nr:hypothetical protein [Candidatus Bathyarchaeota archaeon]HIJ08070.1 hypothetical protein [Candidatus Bathyarchaeota archaeon]
MKSVNHKPAKEDTSNREGKISASKRRMIERSKKWKPNTSAELREAYFTKIEWVQKVIPKLTKEEDAEAVEEIL